MSHLLKNSKNKRSLKVLEESFTPSEIGELVFSYSVKKTNSNVVLHQKETGFSLLMGMEKVEEVLLVKSFHLACHEQLEEVTIALSDAALIEIILEGLEVLYDNARRQKVFEIFFMLTEEDAKHLTSIEGVLGACSSIITREGKRTTFSLFAFPEARDVLLEKAKSIKIQVKHELWKSQRNNHFLKDYLQNNQKGKLFPCCQETVLEITPVKGNVISFPQV